MVYVFIQRAAHRSSKKGPGQAWRGGVVVTVLALHAPRPHMGAGS